MLLLLTVVPLIVYESVAVVALVKLIVTEPTAGEETRAGLKGPPKNGPEYSVMGEE